MDDLEYKIIPENRKHYTIYSNKYLYPNISKKLDIYVTKKLFALIGFPIGGLRLAVRDAVYIKYR
jgi:hypothetical protein